MGQAGPSRGGWSSQGNRHAFGGDFLRMGNFMEEGNTPPLHRYLVPHSLHGGGVSGKTHFKSSRAVVMLRVLGKFEIKAWGLR